MDVRQSKDEDPGFYRGDREACLLRKLGVLLLAVRRRTSALMGGSAGGAGPASSPQPPLRARAPEPALSMSSRGRWRPWFLK